MFAITHHLDTLMPDAMDVTDDHLDKIQKLIAKICKQITMLQGTVKVGKHFLSFFLYLCYLPNELTNDEIQHVRLLTAKMLSNGLL